MNRKQYRTRLAQLTNHPNRGAKGTARLNDIMNFALRQIWGELPTAMLSEEYRMRLEPPETGLIVTSDATDRLSFSVTGAFLSSAGALDPQIYRGRTLEVAAPDGEFHYFTIRDFGGQPPVTLSIIVGEPWNGAADAGMSARIITKEYPYPHDVQQIHKVWYAPENQPAVVMRPMARESIDILSWLNGVRNTGQPQAYARGDFYQQEPPHYTPAVEVKKNPQLAEQWGFAVGDGLEHGDTSGRQPFYGAAGTFSYKICHVLGRQRWPLTLRDTPDAWERRPFYISAPSEASPQRSAVWGGGALEIVTPDIDYLDGYGPHTNRVSYHHAGVEKWIFRARHATEDPTSGTNNAKFKRPEDDGVYYLWLVIPGHNISVLDNGSFDPVERTFRLKDMFGHNHLRLDRLPTDDAFVRMHVSRRPPVLEHDNDVPRIPPEVQPLLMNLLIAYVQGTLDGRPDREGAYFKAYWKAIEDLRELYGLPGHSQEVFGDGLSTMRDISGRWDSITEIP